MSSVINTNQASLLAQQHLSGAQNALANSVERLSSGLRVNRAKDDAASLGVGENLQKQLNGIKQGLNNVNDAISMAQTAEGALAAVAAIAQRIITLATQGANDTLNSDQRASIGTEIDKLRTSIQDIAKRTKYTDTRLFSSKAMSIQVSNNADDQVVISSTALKGISIDTDVTLTASAGASGANLMTFASVTGIVVGQTITGTGVQANTTVVAIDATAKQVTLSSNLSQAATNNSYVFSTTPSTTGGNLDTKITTLKNAVSYTATMFTDIQDTAAKYLTAITAQRGELGAIQNQLEYTVANLTEYSNNLAASRSRVMDTDYASETATLTKGQILQQASSAMLAQANQMPNVILTLLK